MNVINPSNAVLHLLSIMHACLAEIIDMIALLYKHDKIISLLVIFIIILLDGVGVTVYRFCVARC